MNTEPRGYVIQTRAGKLSDKEGHEPRLPTCITCRAQATGSSGGYAHFTDALLRVEMNYSAQGHSTGQCHDLKMGQKLSLVQFLLIASTRPFKGEVVPLA